METEKLDVEAKEDLKALGKLQKDKKKPTPDRVNISVTLDSCKWISEVSRKLNKKKKFGSKIYSHHIVSSMVKKLSQDNFDDVLDSVIGLKDRIEMELEAISAKNPGKSRDEFILDALKSRKN